MYKKDNGIEYYQYIARETGKRYLREVRKLSRVIEEKKKTEAALILAEKKYRDIFENTTEGIFQSTPGGRFVSANPALAHMYGYTSPEELMHAITDLGEQLYVDKIRRSEFVRLMEEKDAVHNFEARVLQKNGGIGWISINARNVRDEKGITLYYEGTIENITARKLAEAELKFRNLILATQQETSIDGILVVDDNGKILSFNQRFVDMWGIDSEIINTRSIERVIEPVLNNLANPQELLQKIRYLHTHKQELSRDEIVVKDGRIFDRYSVPMFGSDERYYGRVWYFRDITEQRRAEGELQKTLVKLRETLAGTIQAVSLTVEAKDPYTAGHQKRVSTLAQVIAKEMGLSHDTVDMIRMAGIIHDIGKISVPSEILSKPANLTDIEFNLIKTHPLSGYNIIKDTGLPHLIAQIILQHHERLDGSGYPHGLKNDHILLEARILAVADVVEAIASHRPYRPAYGIDMALEEIKKKQGILYDNEVVRTCLALFREKQFKFE